MKLTESLTLAALKTRAQNITFAYLFDDIVRVRFELDGIQFTGQTSADVIGIYAVALEHNADILKLTTLKEPNDDDLTN